MITAKKVTRYYAECGHGYWKRKAAEEHEARQMCWRLPSLRTCKTCEHAAYFTDDNGGEGSGYGSWPAFECRVFVDQDSDNWHPPDVHGQPLEMMNIHCPKWEQK